MSESKLLSSLMTALVAGGIAYAVVSGARAPRVDARGARLDVTHVATKSAEASLDPHTGELTIVSDDRKRRQIGLSVVVDKKTRALSFPRSALQRQGDSIVADIALDADGGELPVRLTLRPDRDTDSFEILLHVRTSIPGAHTLALRADLASEGGAFLSGVGEIDEVAKSTGGALVDGADRAVAVSSAQGEITAAVEAPAARATAKNMHYAVFSPEAGIRAEGAAELDSPAARGNRTGLVVTSAPTTAKAWGQMFGATKVATAAVVGAVWGASERTRVYGLDDEGRPRVRAIVDPGQRFQLDVPPTVVSWYAALGSSETSAPIRNVPGSGYELHLDVSPGGELQVKVVDGDTSQPLLARVIVHGVDGTFDPSFGPDYRASGAGPLVDVTHGELKTPLPKGRYRVAATKGIEWSIDAQTVDITPGHTRAATLTLRRVVPTPGFVGCDLHVHARPSFDSPVSVEDRVVSLVSAGIEFAVPTEHNVVGDYGPALAVLDLARSMATVPGVEVTTYNPKIGHFGVFPYPVGPPPPYRGTTAAGIFTAVHRDPTRVVQVNHPRMPRGIGYFSIAGYDGKNPRNGSLRTDFDTLEVYNGYESPERAKVEVVMRDWYGLLNAGLRIAATGSSDSHRIQYQWAGYPRTLARVEPGRGGDGKSAVEPAQIVAAVKKGRSVITSGPVIELTLDGKGPGEDVSIGEDAVKVHVRVLAAPWVDVTTLEIVAQGQVLAKRTFPSRPLGLGPEVGSLEEAEARTVRWEGDVDVTLPPPPPPPPSVPGKPDAPARPQWLIAIAKGDRKMDDILPFMPVAPMAFTNPVWIQRTRAR